MTKFKLISGVTVPAIARKRRKVAYPFAEMEVGQMFFDPDGSQTLLNAAHIYGSRHKVKFSVRKLHMKTHTRKGWVPCEPEDDGAERGIGVWRVK